MTTFLCEGFVRGLRARALCEGFVRGLCARALCEGLLRGLATRAYENWLASRAEWYESVPSLETLSEYSRSS